MRDGFKFRSGHLALDLAATVAGRKKTAPTDLLATPEDLDRWLVAAQLVQGAPKSSTAALRDVRALREALYRMACSRVEGTAFDAADVVLINRLARIPTPAPQIVRNAVTYVGASVANLVAIIARAGAELLG